MEIICIFEPYLYAFKCGDGGRSSDELSKLFSRWTDAVYLFAFFEQHEQDLNYFGITKRQAIFETRQAAKKFQQRLQMIAEAEFVSLDLLFRNLNNSEYKGNVQLSGQKAKPNGWLRIYALRIAPNHYVITGGTIKLTREMKEREHTRNELLKLQRYKSYLRENDVFDSDSFYEFIF